jgi:hypothetical protein
MLRCNARRLAGVGVGVLCGDKNCLAGRKVRRAKEKKSVYVEWDHIIRSRSWMNPTV